MPVRKLIAVISLSASILAPSAALAASPPSRPPCILNEHRVTSVKPYKVTEQIGRGTFRRLRGAEVYVVAEPGLTREWLQLKLQRHFQQMRHTDMQDCAFDVKEVRVTVDSGGGGFWVKLIAKDSKSAEELLRRAKLQVGS